MKHAERHPVGGVVLTKITLEDEVAETSKFPPKNQRHFANFTLTDYVELPSSIQLPS